MALSGGGEEGPSACSSIPIQRNSGFPNAYKMLVLRMFQSGITPAMLDIYKANCKETHPDKPYQDYGLLPA